MTENELLKEGLILALKRSVRPSIEDNKRIWEILNQLYEINQDKKYKL